MYLVKRLQLDTHMWLDLLWQSILVNMVITISPHATWNSQEVMIDVCTCICNSLFISTTSTGAAAAPLSSREETIARPQQLPRAQRRAKRDSKLQTRNLPKWHFWCALINSGGGGGASYLIFVTDARTMSDSPCKFFLAGVNFYRFNAKNCQFSV